MVNGGASRNIRHFHGERCLSVNLSAFSDNLIRIRPAFLPWPPQPAAEAPLVAWKATSFWKRGSLRYTVHECRARLGFETRPRIVIGSQQIETLLKLGSLDDAEAHRRASILADDIEQIGFDTFQLSCRPYPVLSANGESSQLEHRMGETRRNARTRRQARGREMNAHEGITCSKYRITSATPISSKPQIFL